LLRRLHAKGVNKNTVVNENVNNETNSDNSDTEVDDQLSNDQYVLKENLEEMNKLKVGKITSDFYCSS